MKGSGTRSLPFFYKKMYSLNFHAQENPNEHGILQKHKQINIDAK